VVKADVPLEPETVERIQTYFGPFLPSGVTLLITDPTFELSILNPAPGGRRYSGVRPPSRRARRGDHPGPPDYSQITRDLS